MHATVTARSYIPTVSDSASEPTDEALKALFAWEGVDSVSKQPDLTAFKRRARYTQSVWRDRQGFRMGLHKQNDVVRPIGSRLGRPHADRGDNFLYPEALDAVRHRLANHEPHQLLMTGRLWGDLLSSMPMCFNLFGECWADHDQATTAMAALRPEPPGKVEDVRFEWSPGRLDPRFLNNKSAFDVAFLLDDPSAGRGVVGVETKYHEHANTESRPRADRLDRYLEVTEVSGAFHPGVEQKLIGTDLQQLWLDHLLVLSMLQAPGEGWMWGRFVLVAPSRNPSFKDVAHRYQACLTDTATFAFVTIEDLMAAGVLSPPRRAAFEDRYLW